MKNHSKQNAGFFKRTGFLIKNAWHAISPGQRAWRGAAWGLIIGALFFTAIISHSFSVHASWVAVGIVLLLLIVTAAVSGGLILLLIRFLGAFPSFYMITFFSAGLLLFLSFMTFFTPPSIIFVGMIIVVLSLLGAGIAILVKGGWKSISRDQRVVTALGLALGTVGLWGGGYWLFSNGRPVNPPLNASLQSKAAISPLALPDPSQPGSYPVCTLNYGSGKDHHRPEFGANVDLKTKPVDGSAFVEGWSGLRERYWGFGPEALPLNARVWFPDGPGPFPLALIVHGNHIMEDYSDSGYDYLGELLASRGIITASVDENFFNVSVLVLPNGFLKEENDARGWLLLEHIKQWHMWNAIPGNIFYQKVDLKNIALMGHSRGGEAALVAASFNRLPYYPDDATVTFDYNFSIRSVVAIAPIDGAYRPTGKLTPLENVNYFVLQGVQDMDCVWFLGARAYKRIKFTDGQFWMKAAVYIYGANHGQFNTTWGRKDQWEPVNRLFNLKQLMPAEEQRQIAKVYISAFLEATLKQENGYLPLFRDYRTSPGWLPNTIYLNQYDDAATQLISTYEEDINLATTTLSGGMQKGENLTIWREQLVPINVFGSLDNNAVYLGWDAVDTDNVVPSYVINLPTSGISLNGNNSLVFSLADANEDPNPKAKEKRDKHEKDISRSPIDLTIQVIDQSGTAVQVPLSSYALLQPQIEDHILKADWMRKPLPPSEIVFQTFEFPLANFMKVTPSFDPTTLTMVRFLFDRTPTGVVVLDDNGFR